MDICCKEYVSKCKPEHNQDGVFREIQRCDKCNKALRITFEGLPCLGDDNNPPAYRVIKAEYATRSR
jgi:hypothetical protein